MQLLDPPRFKIVTETKFQSGIRFLQRIPQIDVFSKSYYVNLFDSSMYSAWIQSSSIVVHSVPFLNGRILVFLLLADRSMSFKFGNLRKSIEKCLLHVGGVFGNTKQDPSVCQQRRAILGSCLLFWNTFSCREILFKFNHCV